MQQTLTNEQIFSFATLLEKYPISDDIYIPAAANFYIQKNIMTLMQLKAEIDNCRLKIISHYGEQSNDKVLKVKDEYIEVANEELKALSQIKQEVSIQMIPVAALSNISLSVGQLKSLMFMLEDMPLTQEKSLTSNHNTEYIPLV